MWLSPWRPCAAMLLLLPSCLASPVIEDSADCSVAGADCVGRAHIISRSPHRCGRTTRGGLICSQSFQAACAGKEVGDTCDSHVAECCLGEKCAQCTFTGGKCVENAQRVNLCLQCNRGNWFNPACTECDEPTMMCVNASGTGLAAWASSIKSADDYGPDQQMLILWLCLVLGMSCPCCFGLLGWSLYSFWRRHKWRHGRARQAGNPV